MLNLLFISDSPKADHIKSALQPELKVIIDVVSDFDHGLKDVFEKRPATVCIQDQIGGVTGESVARHIQMLLGSSAPRFILLHSGNGKARTINGLFEHLIDLNQANDTLYGDIKNTLKTLLGDHWEKIYIPPKLAPASVRSSVALPEEAREDADKLVDDFISDLETSGFSVVDEQPPELFPSDNVLDEKNAVPQAEPSRKPEDSSPTVESDRAQSLSDDLAELLIQEADKAKHADSPVLVSPAVEQPAVAPAVLLEPAPGGEKLPPPAVRKSPAPRKASSGEIPAKKIPAPKSGTEDTKSAATTALQPPEPPAQEPVPLPPAPPAAAEFRINHDDDFSHPEEQIPEDLLLAFEENYRSESSILRRGIVIALVCIVCAAAGGWFLVTQKPQLLAALKQRIMPASTPKQALPLPSPLPAVSKPVAAPVPPPVTAPSLPSFVPKDGLDPSYGSKNPGWERYVGKNAEFRLFRASGRAQALQVLAIKGAPLSDLYIKSALREFAGAEGYQITSSSVKSGVRVESGKVQDKAEVKIYRKNGTVKAFVVSVN
jgi:hypothetical protein